MFGRAGAYDRRGEMLWPARSGGRVITHEEFAPNVGSTLVTNTIDAILCHRSDHDLCRIPCGQAMIRF
jgi:hypothetical protein